MMREPQSEEFQTMAKNKRNEQQENGGEQAPDGGAAVEATGSATSDVPEGAEAVETEKEDGKTIRVGLSDETRNSKALAMEKYKALGFTNARANKLLRAEAERLCAGIDVVALFKASID